MRIAEWGYDYDGDLTLRVGFIYFTLYKYQEPTVSLNRHGFRACDAAEIRHVWHRAQCATPESNMDAKPRGGVDCNAGKFIAEGFYDGGSGIHGYFLTKAAAKHMVEAANRRGGELKVGVNPFYGTAWDRFKLAIELVNGEMPWTR